MGMGTMALSATTTCHILFTTTRRHGPPWGWGLWHPTPLPCVMSCPTTAQGHGPQHSMRPVLQVLRVLERGGCPPTPDDVAAVRNHSLQMLQLLAEERPRAGAAQPGPILAFVAQEQVLARLLRWHACGGFPEEQRLEQLRLYEVLLAQARQAVLRHGAVRTPLLRLLRLCAQPSSPALQHGLVLLLNQLCVCVAKEPAILELFFHSPPEQGPTNIIIFSLLVPFIHHEGVLGQQARDALLLIMAMSANNHAVAKSITDNSYFCPVWMENWEMEVEGWG